MQPAPRLWGASTYDGPSYVITVSLWPHLTYASLSDSVVQDHRGNIIEGLGCVPVINHFTLTYPLVTVWLSFLSFVAAIYACLSFRIFLSLRRRNTIDELFSSGYSISKDHYLRLMGFSLIPILLTFPFTLTSLIINIKFGPVPWVSWEDAHSNFNRFDSYPAAVVEADPYIYATWMINLCACLVCCFLFFIFLGLNPEQRRQYRRWFFIILRPFGIKPALSSRDSPTVWRRLFGRTTATTTTLIPTPFTFIGATASISKVPVAHRLRDILNPTDLKVIGREIFEHDDYQGGERGERGNLRDGRPKAKAILGSPRTLLTIVKRIRRVKVTMYTYIYSRSSTVV